jgi:transcriptional regulator ATRX
LHKTFKCTICSEMLNASDVHRHPVLDVVVCGSCRFLVIEKNRLEVNAYLLKYNSRYI